MAFSQDLKAFPGNEKAFLFAKENEWDLIVLAGVLIPAYVEVDVDADSGLDEQKAIGKKKSKARNGGQLNAMVTINFKILSSDFDNFTAVAMPLLRPGNKQKGQPILSAVHPNLALFDITAIQIAKISSKHPMSGGYKEISVRAIEYSGSPKNVDNGGSVSDGGYIASQGQQSIASDIFDDMDEFH